MITTHTEMARETLERSLEIREEHGFDFRSPLCIYELCERVGVAVRFTDNIASMEGVYAALKRPKIILSSLRPLARRAFTCAHELGHHVFGHGSTIDELHDDAEAGDDVPQEFIANAFAGFVLMPAQAVKRAFSLRHIDMPTASAETVYRIACSFGVGYETLVSHLAYSLKYITHERAKTLAGAGLPKIRGRILGFPTKEPLVIADRHHAIGTIDAEIGTQILLPKDTTIDSEHLEMVKDVSTGRLFRAIRPGLVRGVSDDFSVIVRISRFQYSGLARYRHLEEINNE